jgi:hypothetical protein
MVMHETPEATAPRMGKSAFAALVSGMMMQLSTFQERPRYIGHFDISKLCLDMQEARRIFFGKLAGGARLGWEGCPP